VTAGTVNCDGSLVVRATAAGDATVLADIVRLVETAQARAAPVQRLADAVAGRFAYGVIGASAATFCFWTLFGQQLFPQVIPKTDLQTHIGTSANCVLSSCFRPHLPGRGEVCGRRSVEQGRVGAAGSAASLQRVSGGLSLRAGPCCTHRSACRHVCW